MDTLHDRLAELAADAPTGGAPAAELWARGKRAHRLRSAALATTLLAVGVVGIGISAGLADGDGEGPDPAPAGTIGFALPIEYPVGEELPDLGDAPGPLAAIWLVPPVGGGAPEAVGLVAETGAFGTLPLDVSYMNEDHELPALAPDGRRIAYASPSGEPTVHDLVSGEIYNWPEMECPGTSSQCYRWGTGGYTWFDSTHLFGIAGASDTDGYVWEPGTAPKLVNPITYAGTPYRGLYAGRDLQVVDEGGGPRSCAVGEPFDDLVGGSPVLNATGGTDDQGDDELFDVPVLCDVLGVIGSDILLGHWNSDRLPGDWDDPNDGNGTVVALDIRGDAPFEDPALRRVVVTAGAPEWATFATDLIGESLDADGGGSDPDPAPAETVGISLPIEYPVGEELPDLGDTPGPLAAIWLDRVGSGAPEAVGLVAETETFGTLPIDVFYVPEDNLFEVVALSPDGRRIAYLTPTEELIVHDLVSGESFSPPSDFRTRAGYTWVDSAHLLGLICCSDVDGWVWEPEPGTAPELVNPYYVSYGGTDLAVPQQGLGPRECTSPILQNVETLRETGEQWAGSFVVPVLCDVLGILSGSEVVLGHWNSDRLPGDWEDPNDGNRTVVALDIHGADPPEYFSEDSEHYRGFDDPALHRVVATAGAPERVTFATDLIGEALDADGGAS